MQSFAGNVRRSPGLRVSMSRCTDGKAMLIKLHGISSSEAGEAFLGEEELVGGEIELLGINVGIGEIGVGGEIGDEIVTEADLYVNATGVERIVSTPESSSSSATRRPQTRGIWRTRHSHSAVGARAIPPIAASDWHRSVRLRFSVGSRQYELCHRRAERRWGRLARPQERRARASTRVWRR